MAPFETKPQAEPDKQLRFEALLVEISTLFINLPVDRIDSEIQVAQRRVCEFLDLDRSSLFQVPEEDYETLLLTHINQPEGSRIPPEQMSAKEFFPWVGRKVLDGKTITIAKMTDLPAEAGRDRESFDLFATKSVVVVPLSVGNGPVFGLLTFSVMKDERAWTEKVVQQFKAVAQIFVSALVRKQTEEELRKSKDKLDIVIDAAGAGMWIMALDTGYVWVTPKTRELFHFDPDEELNNESFFKVIHPDENEQVQQAVQHAIQSGEDLRCEFRVVQPDGSMRWIEARGKPNVGSTGKSDRLMGVSVDITERKRAEQALQERLQFETLLTEISASFVNQSADRIDSEIEGAQRRICELLKLDLVAIWQWSDKDPGIFTLTHLYSAQEISQPSLRMNQDHFPWCQQQMLAGRIVAFSSLEELPAEAARDRESCRLFGIKSNLTIPLSMGVGQPVGVLGFNTTQAERDWPDGMVNRLQLVAQIFINALERKRMEDQRQEHLREIENLKKRIEQENIYLQEEVKLLTEHTGIVGQSLAIKRVLSQAEQVAETDSTVLILGETGTGKELLARAIHNMSDRKDRPLVTVNCASLPSALIESELFGREKGAYTGALTRMIGRFELADGSTVFLDEIGELPHEVQSKLLQVLEQGRFERLGSTQTLQVNVRIITATNRDLAQDVAKGKFRKDLYYRLNVFPISIPPLRERADDIPLMVWTFVKEFQKRMGKEIESIPQKTMQALQACPWPGNVRELRNVIEHAMILNKDKSLDISMPGLASLEVSSASHLDEVEREHIMGMLEKTGWRVAGKNGAAEALGLKRTTLYTKMKKLGIDRPTSK